VKNAPNAIVAAKPLITSALALYAFAFVLVAATLLVAIALCAHVTVTPEDNKIAVFNKGSAQGLIVWIPKGGQTAPIQIDGDTLE
jgi:hypothetical protein